MLSFKWLLTVFFFIGNVLSEDLLFLDTLKYVEYDQAVALGYTVKVVDSATFASMTTADFAMFKALVFSDPDCGSLDAIAVIESSKAAWSAAIKGNVVLIGTDPTFHSMSGIAGATALIKDTIPFAAGGTGGTGLYFSLSCYYVGEASEVPVTSLSELGSFTITQAGGCFNNVHIVASSPALGTLSDADLSNWSCSIHEVFTDYPMSGLDSYVPLAIALNIGTAGSQTFGDGTMGLPYILVRGATPAGCGDGIWQESLGEECDDGSMNGMDGDPCSAACKCLSGRPDGAGSCLPPLASTTSTTMSSTSSKTSSSTSSEITSTSSDMTSTSTTVTSTSSDTTSTSSDMTSTSSDITSTSTSVTSTSSDTTSTSSDVTSTSTTVTSTSSDTTSTSSSITSTSTEITSTSTDISSTSTDTTSMSTDITSASAAASTSIDTTSISSSTSESSESSTSSLATSESNSLSSSSSETSSSDPEPQSSTGSSPSSSNEQSSTDAGTPTGPISTPSVTPSMVMSPSFSLTRFLNSSTSSTLLPEQPTTAGPVSPSEVSSNPPIVPSGTTTDTSGSLLPTTPPMGLSFFILLSFTKAIKRRQAIQLFATVDEDGFVSATSCTTASLFTIGTDARLAYNAVFAFATSKSIAAGSERLVFGATEVGQFQTTFDAAGSVVNWQNVLFGNLNAIFALNPATNNIEVFYSGSPPAGYQLLTLDVVYGTTVNDACAAVPATPTNSFVSSSAVSSASLSPQSSSITTITSNATVVGIEVIIQVSIQVQISFSNGVAVPTTVTVPVTTITRSIYDCPIPGSPCYVCLLSSQNVACPTAGETLFTITTTTCPGEKSLATPPPLTFQPCPTCPGTTLSGTASVVPGNPTGAPANPSMTPGNSNIIPGNSNAIPGGSNSIPGNSNAIPGNSNGIPGNSNAIPGNSNGIPGNSKAIPGNSNGIPGNPGNPSQMPGQPMPIQTQPIAPPPQGIENVPTAATNGKPIAASPLGSSPSGPASPGAAVPSTALFEGAATIARGGAAATWVMASLCVIALGLLM